MGNAFTVERKFHKLAKWHIILLLLLLYEEQNIKNILLYYIYVALIHMPTKVRGEIERDLKLKTVCNETVLNRWIGLKLKLGKEGQLIGINIIQS